MQGKINRKQFLHLALMAPVAVAAQPIGAFIGITTTSPLSNQNVTYYKAGDEAYERLRKGFNKRISKQPAIIALCNNTQGVAEAVAYAAKNNLPVAIKSGGHCMEGFSCNNGGMVINLSAMKNIEWLSEDTIKVNPACTLSQLYDALLPKKKILPGGSCAGVGIGGLVLGGGYGLMARKFGLTCDSLQAVTMVDGNGKLLSSAEDSDLLWVCKGGNNGNFGVVTEFTFKVHPAPATMESFRFRAYKVTAERAKAIMEQWFALTAGLPNECFSAFVLNGKTLYILLTNIGRRTPAVQQLISVITALTDKTTRTPAQPLQRALKTYYGKTEPLFFKNASAGLYKSFAEIAPFISKSLEIVVATPGMIYQVNTLGGNIQQAAFETASAFPYRAYPYFSELQTYWDLPRQENRLLAKFEEVQEVFTSNGIAAQYRNYPDINFTNAMEKYYGNNYKRLQQLKLKYDPANIFRYEQSVKNS